MSWADTLFLQASGGEWFQAMIASYTNLFGGFFYVILLSLALVMIYIKTGNFGTVAIVGIATSFAIITLAPGISFYGFMMIVVLGVAGIIYKLIR